MHTTSPTGRLVSSQPAYQRLPLPLSPAQRAEVDVLKAAFRDREQPAFFRWMDGVSAQNRRKRMQAQATDIAGPGASTTLVDSYLNMLELQRFSALYSNKNVFSGLQRLANGLVEDTRAHLALVGISLPPDKTQLAQSIEQAFQPPVPLRVVKADWLSTWLH